MGQFLTNTSSVIIEDFITRIAGTEIGTIGVGTILVAFTVVTCTLINIYNYMERSSCNISILKCCPHIGPS